MKDALRVLAIVRNTYLSITNNKYCKFCDLWMPLFVKKHKIVTEIADF